jgi:hypothetical protein
MRFLDFEIKIDTITEKKKTRFYNENKNLIVRYMNKTQF